LPVNAADPADARLALACLDLTSLNDADTEQDVELLCRRAATAHGCVAAVCVWPRLAARALRCVPDTVRVAAVANFPLGAAEAAAVAREVAGLAEAGLQEVDLVLPWRALKAGDGRTCAAVVQAARRAAPGLTLKLIVESGELAEPRLIAEACRLGIGEGADFLKTSTGKTPTGATPAAAEVMLQVIAADPAARVRVGFKASGGIRTVAGAAVYLRCVERVLGRQALVPQRLRFGASALLNDIAAILAGPPRAPDAAAAGTPG
jgi:deoxyribose-phosphate aldolase